MATQSKFYADLGIKSATHTEIDGNLTIGGNLTVQGTQTIIDSTTSSVVDSMMELASGNTSADLIDIGFYGNYNDGIGSEVVFLNIQDYSEMHQILHGSYLTD